MKVFLQNIWREWIFSIPLHSLCKTSRPASCLKRIRKEFFEKIYINREVVQEASVWFYVRWMGKRNEPINSSSLLLRPASITGNRRKGAFYLILEDERSGTEITRWEFCLVVFTANIKFSSTHILQWRVWSWLRMNAGYRLNTCKSRGNGIGCLHRMDVDRRTGE